MLLVLQYEFVKKSKFLSKHFVICTAVVVEHKKQSNYECRIKENLEFVCFLNSSPIFNIFFLRPEKKLYK